MPYEETMKLGKENKEEIGKMEKHLRVSEVFHQEARGARRKLGKINIFVVVFSIRRQGGGKREW